MKNRNNEQAAFPSGPLGDSMKFGNGRTTHQYPAQPGMSLRDWFAGKALSGMLADPDGGRASCKSIARSCYAVADAMMEAREAKQ